MPHDLTIHKRVRDGQLVPFPTSSNSPPLPEHFDQDSNAVCSCGWTSGWKSTEQSARDEFLDHLNTSNLTNLSLDWTLKV